MAKRRTVGEQMALGIGDERKVGRVERAVSSALRIADDELSLDSRIDAGMMTLARSMAAQVDVAEAKRDPYAGAAASRELREVLVRLKLDPTSRTAGTVNELADLLAGITQPTPPKA